jgi:predicted membrane protein
MTDYKNRRNEDNRDNRRQDGRMWTGIFILVVGVAALLKTSISDFPDWLFSWQTLLIAIGFFIGIRHNFRDASWLVLVLVGTIFLIHEVVPQFSFRRYLWPIAIIIVGLFIIMRPRRQNITWFNDPATGFETEDNKPYSKEDYVEGTSLFGGQKKNIISKNFKGGDIVNIFGGTELDLTQADFSGTAVLEITTIFGGTKLIVPSNWNVKSDAVNIFGGIDDKRKMQPLQEVPDKILLLKGTILFGGIEIKSY